MADGSNPFQRTAEWFSVRCGCLTASMADKAIKTTLKGTPTAERKSLLWDLVAERITAEPTSRFSTPEMQWGEEHEADAVTAYEMETGNPVTLSGFVAHPTIPWFGASPDGLVGEDGLIEIKCPKSKTHLERLVAGVVPPEYKTQMIVQLLCTGRKWVDFVDYDPRCAPYDLFIIRFEPSEEEKEQVLEKCQAFLAEVKAVIDQLTERKK